MLFFVSDKEKGIRASRSVKGKSDDPFEIPDVPHEWNGWYIVVCMNYVRIPTIGVVDFVMFC